MKFDWSEFLDLAQALAKQTVAPSWQEAALRSAVSRAYYAAFCKARNHLRDREGHRIPATGRAHQYVRDKFKKSPDKTRKRIGSDLDRLRSDRNRVDYDDVVLALDAMTNIDLVLAGRVISILGKL